MTVNPDLVFNHGRAIGDVKYKIFAGDWSRSDLYQNVAFATAFHTSSGCVLAFKDNDDGPTPPSVVIGDITVTPIAASDVGNVSRRCSHRSPQGLREWLEGP